MNDKFLDDTIQEAIKKITLQEREITDETDLIKDLELDSLDIVEFYTILEKRFDVVVRDDEIATHGTKVKDIKELISKYL